jgi:cold shock CspA family protein
MAELIESEAKETIHTYNSNKGCGFLRTFDISNRADSSNSVDVFFHISDVPANSVKEGWRFQFSLMRGEEGYKTEDIMILSKRADQQNGGGEQNTMMMGRGSSNKEEPDTYMLEEMQKNKDSNNEDGSEEIPFEQEDIRGSKNDIVE